MSNTHPSLATDRHLGLSGLLTAPIGYLVLLFLPVYLEVAAERLALTDAEIGWLAATDASGLALATLVFSLAIKRLNFRTVVIAGVVISVAGNLSSLLTTEFVTLCLVRTLTGFGEGLLVAVGVTAVGMTANPNRWFGFYTAVVVAVQAIGLLLVPMLYAWGDLAAIYGAMAGLYLAPLVVLRWLPARCDGGQESATGDTQPIGLLSLALLGLLFFYICIGGVWTYVSFMGTDQSLTLDYVSRALAVAMIAGFGGALFFAWLGERGKRHGVLLVSAVVMIGCLWWLNTFQGASEYLAILCVYSFVWSILGARLFAVIADADSSGTFISAAQTIVGVGFMVGPMIAASLVTDHGYPGVNAMGMVTLVLCVAAVLPLAQRNLGQMSGQAAAKDGEVDPA